MSRYDVAVVGAGVAGLTAAALLAREGRTVAVLEKSGHHGGRAISRRYRGHRLMLGAHLLEDPGDGLTRILESFGHRLDHSVVNDNLPFWDRDRWVPIQQLYRNADRGQLRALVGALLEADPREFDSWDHAPLRDWMAQHTRDEGVWTMWETIAMLEQLTDRWYDHSASDNLYNRRLHYQHAGEAGYSFWPPGGYDTINDWLREDALRFGAEIRLRTPVDSVVIEGGRVRGLRAAGEVVEADQVVVTSALWDLLSVFEPGALPFTLEERVRMLSHRRNRVSWLGYWIAAPEPIYQISPRELAGWLRGPRTGLAGFFFCNSALDPTISPPGEHLMAAGAPIDPARLGDRAWIQRTFAELWEELVEMYPRLRQALWKRAHVVSNYAIASKPGLVGAVRPPNQVHAVEGLWLAGDTVRGRGIGVDRSARSALTVAEGILGRRLPEFAETWRY